MEGTLAALMRETGAESMRQLPTLTLFKINMNLEMEKGTEALAAAVEAAQAVTAEVFLLGVTGVHHEAGLTTGDSDEAAMKRALARRAAETYVLASAEKVGAASPFLVLPLAAVSGVVTDAAPDDPAVRQLVAAGARIVEPRARAATEAVDRRG